jgi:hypothetical protein
MATESSRNLINDATASKNEIGKDYHIQVAVRAQP